MKYKSLLFTACRHTPTTLTRVTALVAALMFAAVVRVVRAQERAWSFDPEAYRSLVDAASPETIAPGTRIDAQNWQKYKNFLPIGVQALFSRTYHWSIPAEPDFEMVVGPTVPIPPPYKYQRDTERYAGSVKLARTSDSRMGMTGYVAGQPFPDLRKDDPDLVYKLMYDSYFYYHPAILFYRQHASLFDTYLNRTDTIGTVVEFRLSHISDEGYPLSEPLAPNDVFFTSNITVEAPEQNKYTVNLQIYYDDPNRLQDIYTYIPSLRRSIRRSSAARCSPILGTDVVQDDIYPRPVLLNQFSYRLLGYKKVLFQMHLDTQHLFKETSFNLRGVPGWPKPVIGPWELRKVWVVEQRALPSNRDYCYGIRVSYMDAQGFLIPGLDVYDRNLKLWKVFNSGYAPGPLDDGHGSIFAQANTRSLTVDLISSHATVSIQSAPGRANGQVPEKYRDAQVWALPAGLPQMNP